MSHQIAAQSPPSLRKKLALRIQSCLTRTRTKPSPPTTTSRSTSLTGCDDATSTSSLTLVSSPTPSQEEEQDLAHPHITHLLTTHFPSQLDSGLIKTLYPPTLRLSTLVSLAHAHLDARSQGIRACGKLIRAAGIHDAICVVIWDSLVPLAQDVEGLVDVLDGERFRAAAMDVFLDELEGGEGGCIWCPEGLGRGTCRGVVRPVWDGDGFWRMEERYIKKWGEPLDSYGGEGRVEGFKALEDVVVGKAKAGRRSWFRLKGA